MKSDNSNNNENKLLCPTCGSLFICSQCKSELNSSHLLLVEGYDDKFFFIALLNYFRISGIQIVSYNGKDNLLKILKALQKRPDFNIVKSVGITRDADEENINDLFKTICINFKDLGFQKPNKIGEFTTAKSGQIQTGIYIFPNCKDKGALEDLCLKAIEKSPQMMCVNNFITCLEKIEKIQNGSKTKLYAWLSSQERANLRLGEAANKNFFNFDHICFEELRHFINGLQNL